MTKTDILISKDQEIKRLNDQIKNLEEKLTNLNISIGSKDAVLKSEKEKLERELELAKDQQKVIIKSASGASTRRAYVCNNCGYVWSTSSYGCPDCGSSNKQVFSDSSKVEYKNLDTELAEIKKTVEKQMKKSVADLEDKQLDLEIKIESLEGDLKRKDKRHNVEIDDLQSKNLERINKYREQIEELNQEMIKVKKGKTDAELESKRKEEVEKLQAANRILAEKLEEAVKVGFWRRLWNRLFIDRVARKEAIVEVLKANQLTKKLEDTRDSKWGRMSNHSTTSYTTPYGAASYNYAVYNCGF